MKKVLLLTEVFPPAFNPRMGYLVKNLPEFGWDADIITINTLKENNFKFLVGENKITRVDLKYSDTPNRLIEKIWRTLNLKRHFINNKKPFINKINLNFNKDEYSVILVSVSWDLFVLDAGLTISKLWGIPLLADIRDIIEQKPSQLFSGGSLKSRIDNLFTVSFNKMKLHMRNKILKHANTVTTISPYHVEKLSVYNQNVNLIYNGFDPDLFKPGNIEKTATFFIVYTGIVLNENEQDPSLLFEAVSQLEKDKIIDNSRFKIQFYTPENFRSAVISNSRFHDVEKYIEFFDYIDYLKVPELLKRCSIALVLTNTADSNGPKGIVTTKFFDYLGAERPVLCVRSDEYILESIINRANIGISARTAGEVYNFILEKWNEWKEKSYTTANINQEYKQQFTRKAQAKQFVDLFEKALQ
jgi:glycosyltransferase involved in cell wall biosynthesis